MGDTEKELSTTCRDCVVVSFQKIIEMQFGIIRIFIYVLSALALTVASSEVIFKNFLGVLK